jgi:hypothetical protein
MERDLLVAILRTDFIAFIQRAFTEVEPHNDAEATTATGSGPQIPDQPLSSNAGTKEA